MIEIRSTEPVLSGEGDEQVVEKPKSVKDIPPSEDESSLGAYWRNRSLPGQVFGLIEKGFAMSDFNAFNQSYPLYPAGTEGPALEVPELSRSEIIENIPEEDRAHYDWCNTKAEFEYQSDRLLESRQNEEILERNSGKGALFALGEGVLEANFLPLASVKAIAELNALRASKAASTAAISVASAKIAGEASLRYEAIVQGAQYLNQEDKTFANAAISAAANAIVGAAIGGGIGYLSAPKTIKLAEDLAVRIAKNFPEVEFTLGKNVEIGYDPETTLFSGIPIWKGARKTFSKDLEKDLAAVEPAAQGEGERIYSYADMPKFLQTIIQSGAITKGLKADSNVVNLWTDVNFAHNYQTLGRKKGLYIGSQSREAVTQVREGIHYAYFSKIRGAAKEFVAENPNYSLKDFGLLTCRGIRGSDSVLNPELAGNPKIIEAVNAHNDWLKGTMDDTVLYELFGGKDIRAGDPILGLDPEEAVRSGGRNVLRYLHTMFDKKYCLNHAAELTNDLTEKYMVETPGLSFQAAKKSAVKTVDKILNSEIGDYYSPSFVVKETSITRERALLTKFNDFVKFERYLINDPAEIMSELNRKLASKIELARVTKETFTPEFIKTNFAEEIELIGEKKFIEEWAEKTSLDKWLYLLKKERDFKIENSDPKLEGKIRKEFGKYELQIKDADALLSGYYDLPKHWFDKTVATIDQSARLLNTLRQQGMILVASLPDIANGVFHFGGERFLKSALYDACFKDSAFQLNKADLRRFGAASELCGMHMANKYLGYSDYNGYFKNSMTKLSQAFSRVTGLAYFNDHLKRVVGTLYGNDIITACIYQTYKNFLKSGQKIRLKTGEELSIVRFLRDKNNKATMDNLLKELYDDSQTLDLLTEARIPKEHWKEIADRFIETGGFDKNGLAIFRGTEWRNDEISRNFFGSLVAKANGTITALSHGNAPLLFKNRYAKIFTQYMSFAYAVSDNIIYPALFNAQTENKSVLAGFLTSIALNVISLEMKAAERNNPYAALDDPSLWRDVLSAPEMGGYLGQYSLSLLEALYKDKVDKGFGEIIARSSPFMSLGADLWRTIVTIPSKKKEYAKKGLTYRESEYDRNVEKGLYPFNSLPGLDYIWRRANRRDTAIERGKLLKTRRQKYEETENRRALLKEAKKSYSSESD